MKSKSSRRNRYSPAGEPLLDAGIKVAAISIRPAKWDKAHNADKMESFFRRAARQKPALILATEGMLEGYVIYDVVWNRERVPALLDIAEPLDGPYMTRFRKLAASLKTCLAFGFAERSGREVSNSAVFIDHRGNICGTYHKATEGTGTHPSWNFCRPGREFRAFDTPLGRCGFLICSDRWHPTLARALVLDGAQFLLIPTYGFTGKSQNEAVLARARENGVPVVQANATGMSMIVSHGETVAYQRGVDRITTGFIDVPAAPSLQSSRACERGFQKIQRRMEHANYRKTIRAMRKRTPPRDVRGALVSEHDFQRLQKTHWGEMRLAKATRP